MDESKLTKAEMYKDNDGYYLRLEYEMENDSVFKKIVVPKARLYISDRFEILNENKYLINKYVKINNDTKLLLDKGYFDLEMNKIMVKDYYFEEVHMKTREMTIDEIEEALGYKIKIVGEEKHDERL